MQENFSVTELLSAWEHKEQERSDVQPAHSLNTMISRTETAISEVEATMENAEAELGKALDHTEKVINQSRQQISSESTTEMCDASDAEDSVISDGTISEEILDEKCSTPPRPPTTTTTGTTTTSQSYCTAMSELSEQRLSDSSDTKVNDLTESDYVGLVTSCNPTDLTESDLANQILNSAASIRHSESDPNVKEPRDERLTLSTRSSLTDAHFIEQQTRTSFRALFGETIPAGQETSTGSHSNTTPKIDFSEVDVTTLTTENLPAIASGNYESSELLGALSNFSDDVFNSRGDGPVSAPAKDSSVFTFPSQHPNQMLHPGLGITKTRKDVKSDSDLESKALTQEEIDTLIEDKGKISIYESNMPKK